MSQVRLQLQFYAACLYSYRATRKFVTTGAAFGTRELRDSSERFGVEGFGFAVQGFPLEESCFGMTSMVLYLLNAGHATSSRQQDRI